jgi:hypothetical protein
MKKKGIIILAVVLMLFSAFAELDLVKRANAISNGMCMDPNTKTVVAGSIFNWPLNISTIILVSAWEAKIMWDPGLVRCLGVTFGSFMTPSSDAGNCSIIGAAGEAIMLGQYFTQPHTVTGDGILATLQFKALYPQETKLTIRGAMVYEDSLVRHNLLPPPFGEGDTVWDPFLTFTVPCPKFTWKTDDGINPLPTHTCYEGGRTTIAGTVVHFNASQSHDGDNVYWNGSAWVGDGSYPDTVKFLWDYGDGKSDIYGTEYGNYSTTTDHTYTAYNKAGWLVNLTVWDSENECWSSTWRYGGPDPSNIVPMWRDLAIADIWPSLPPYYLWEEWGEDLGWWWKIHDVDLWLPNTADPYWNYLIDFPSYGYPIGTTVKTAWQNYQSEGLYVLVTAANLGTVPEKAIINLYALYLEQHVKIGAPTLSVFNTAYEKIGTWSKVINKGSGTGWSCQTVWMPSKNGTYLLFATIQPAQDTAVYDNDRSNDYLLMSKPICNVAVWDKVNHGSNPSYNYNLKTNAIFAQYACDISRNGKVGPEDFALISSNFGKLPPA